MNMNQPGIYAIESPSGKRYIGSAVNLRRRWNGHRTRLMRGVHHNPGLQAACAKYGLDALRFVVLAIVEPAQLVETEQRFLGAFAGQLYNVCPVANSRLGRGQSMATREKIRQGQIGRKRTDETRARMSAAQTGRVVSAVARAKISEAGRGRTHSEATRAKRAAALTGNVHRDNQTGFTGVGPLRGKWRARWANKHLGVFATPEAAYAAVCAARDGRTA